MGYKSVLRSVSASSNQATRQREVQQRKLLREQERLQKKADKCSEKLKKIEQALTDVYAKGKVDKKEYDNLSKRMDDITLDLVVFGKTPGISLGKRYITGKIDKKEFDKICKEILPSGIFKEREEMNEKFDWIKDSMLKFKKLCKERDINKCQKCSSEKKFLLNPLKEVDGLRLCRKCKRDFEEIVDFPGFGGGYYEVEARTVTFEDLEPDISYQLGIKAEYL